MNHFIEILITGSTLLLTFLIFGNPNNVNIKANRWFGFFILSIFLITLDFTLKIVDLEIKNTFASQILNFPSFVLAPIFYLSVCHFINPDRKWRKRDFLHFSFGIVSLIILITVVCNVVYFPDYKFIYFSPFLATLFVVLFAIQLIAYGILSYRILNKHQKNIRLFSSNIENIDLKWLEHIVIGIVFLLLFWALDILLGLSTKSFSYINVLLFFGIHFIAYHSLSQKEVFPFTPIQKHEIIELIEETKSESNTKKKLITDEKLEELKIDLLILMQVEKPFLDCELSLIKLASQLNTSPHILSYTINTGFNENFYQFINRYRIEEAKKLLVDSNMNHFNLVGIGFEVGFNSKTVFNTTFKKITNITPSEFKKQQLTINQNTKMHSDS
ncbi:AraC family transcriptional regulator [Flavobacterium aestivum]|uniref:AraC family transcriptional regulator n=1 Tax=Flavobacterium aestivum TaxID=3003257 RepID=UPI002286372B|nr:AraC family transcriptional regulator [Flavobacterium aestivum]